MTAPLAADRVHVRAPGKLNLFFEVGGVQADGYHDVASAYQAVSLYEDVWAQPSDEFTVSIAGSVDVSGVPADDRNLALRAARLLAQRAGYDGGVHLDIRKYVPVAGGMGGGSADAAAALVACDALWGTDVGTGELQRLAARLGADVPFALMGGTAVGTGRGDQLNPALAKGRFDWVIVPSDVGLSTPEVYEHLDLLRKRTGGALAPRDIGVARAPAVDPGVLQALRAGDPVALAERVRNDLQAAALSLRPELRDALELGEHSGALVGMISGSGPTLAFLAADPESALELQVTLSAGGLTALHVHGPVTGARVMGN
ncbi:4-(cytidine 5'-diphospho)-2-C-methyl-D-erythritol kinase [Microbacterium deminutum]|uniref:4-diphosphocytidyl-2-C-methyl-D-erythritol kinase n=1 Tax=Microbacterium deminutum TaxID=344164 RepID=A0ABN2RDA8_9MICO